ncbi:DUF1613-domain-containing protein [Penicillium hispanicum]|uniref:DUF1613-domain-containing protein n=1 Tax=Penicillium hispanicum TaxID=1080232 RepID=UPI00253FA2C9|nr:DUF1613-domain-containing protein [Penicillium hispanicum]KAJ5595501.1 DUF1613-domain-containing protein [Penicillium hispanicum]
MPKRRNMRDPRKLSAKPLAETVESSMLLETETQGWLTSQDLHEDSLSFSPETVYKMALFLMANPNITSTHLFRADIMYDSQGLMKTPQQTEQAFRASAVSDNLTPETQIMPKQAIKAEGFDLIRTVVRRLIPRNDKLDRPLEQTCHFYTSKGAPWRSKDLSSRGIEKSQTGNPAPERLLITYHPHVDLPEDMPFYHPLLKGLAYLYEFESTGADTGSGTMSLHFLPFTADIPNRLERALHVLLNTYIRLARGSKETDPDDGSGQNKLKDNMIPRHLVQNTYARLKGQYADDLCERWVEETEPSKHVFEDLAITAFLIELWRSMYGVTPTIEKDQKQESSASFPGFVDVACGNGVLVYVLLMEGYSGWGFDARRRKSWGIFPASVQERLVEKIYVPKPFADTLEPDEIGVGIHTGNFPRETFIISNHADELTLWTPLMAALACPTSPLPFISIPCCSHSLSGSRFRYPPPKRGQLNGSLDISTTDHRHEYVEQNPQPTSGDLKALRAAKNDEKTEDGMQNSMYGSLTAKTMSVAEEIGYEVERTMLRIPSTRNMGVVGNRRLVAQKWRSDSRAKDNSSAAADGPIENDSTVVSRIVQIIERECSKDGGIQTAARTWIERAQGLHQGGTGMH